MDSNARKEAVTSVRPEPDPMLRLQYYRETGQADQAKLYEQYLHETGQYRDTSAQAPLPTPKFVSESTRALPTDYSRPGDLTTLGHGLAANVANVVTALPGSEALASRIYATLNHEPYAQAVQDIRTVKKSVPAPMRVAENMLGAAPLALIPGSPALVAAGSAAADQLTDADPNRSFGSRVKGAAIAAPLAGLAGKAADVGVTKLRSVFTPTVGAQQVAREGSIARTDKTLYGDARAESQAAGMKVNVTPRLNAALQDPQIQSYLKVALEDPANAKATPGEVLMHASRLMSRDAQSIGDRMAMKGQFDAALDTQASKLRFAKQKLDEAIADIAPTFPVAQTMHAQGMRDLKAMQQGSDVAKTVFQGRHVAGKRLSTQAPEVYARDIENAVPNVKQAAAEGILGRAKEYPTFARAHVFGTNIPVPFPSAAARSAPGLLRTTNSPNQGMIDFLTKLGVLGPTQAVSP